jgi:hypothetical protein
VVAHFADASQSKTYSEQLAILLPEPDVKVVWANIEELDIGSFSPLNKIFTVEQKKRGKHGKIK